jgi:hypothetical protein
MLFVATGLILAVTATAGATSITIDVVPSSAPNGSSASPSWTSYVANALNSLENGLGNIGNRATDPTAYEIAGSKILPGEIAVTSFNSWRGQVSPPAPFANEYGNRLHFGLHAYGDAQFKLADLTFAMHSSDPTDSLVFTGNFIGYNYSTTRYGINWGTDGVKGGGDDTVYTSGNGTTLVNEIVYVGVGNAWWPGKGGSYGSDPANPIGGAQAAMDDYYAWVNTLEPITVTTTYSILAYSGSASVDVVPEPVTMAGLALGIGCLTRYVRKRR